MGNEATCPTTLQKKLMQKKHSELVKECKKYNVSYYGSKKDITDRLIRLVNKHNTDTKKNKQKRNTKKNRSNGSSKRCNTKNQHKHVQIEVNPLQINEKKARGYETNGFRVTDKPMAVIKFNPFKQETVMKTKEIQNTPEWIEWFDLEVLRNIIGVWVMGERGQVYAFMKLDLKMNDKGENKRWRAHIQKGRRLDGYRTTITNIYGAGDWKLIYPTSIYVRQNIYHICNYYMRYYQIVFMILSRDVINVIADYTLGVGVRSLEMVQLQLILTKQSFRTKQMVDDKVYTFQGCDEGDDLNYNLGFSLGNSLVDLLLFCINQVENKKENSLDDYDNIMKLEHFTDDEEDEYFDQYFHNH